MTNEDSNYNVNAKNCGNCAFCCLIDERVPRQCRKNPPLIEINAHSFPNVDSSWWCGEWKEEKIRFRINKVQNMKKLEPVLPSLVIYGNGTANYSDEDVKKYFPGNISILMDTRKNYNSSLLTKSKKLFSKN